MHNSRWEFDVNARIWCKVFRLRCGGYHVCLPASTLSCILRQLCPRCRSAKIFRSTIYLGLPKMHDRCSQCGLRFNREPGYFLGAMYISYGIALVLISALAVGLWAVTDWRIDRVAIWAIVMFLPFVPALTLLSRVLWIYLDQKSDPEAD